MTSSKPIIVLKSSQDWDTWYNLIQSRARRADVFEYIDPSKAERPTQPTKPEKPTQQQDQTADHYRLDIEDYKEEKKDYERIRKEINDLSTVIDDSVGASLQPILQNLTDSHPYYQLKALQTRLKPSKATQERIIVNQLRQLEKPPNNQNIDKWLDQWEETVYKADALKMPDVTGRRGVDTFLDLLLPYDSEYATIAIRESSRTDASLNVAEYIADYREHVRRKQAVQGKSTNRTTMAATLRGKPQAGGPPPKPCVCGKSHWFQDCPYLNERVRPSGWKPKKEIQDQIQKKMSNPRLKGLVERALNTHAPTKQDQSQDQEDSKDPKSFAAIAITSLSAERKEPTTAQLSWIVDTGSSHHVCNRYMKKRFTKTRNAGPDDVVICGTSRVPIEAFGTVTVNAHRNSGPHTLTLMDVAYIPGFMGNLVSVAKAREKGIHLDTGRMVLYKGDIITCELTFYDNLYFMELNQSRDSSRQITAGLTIRKRPAKQWHEVFAHPSEPVIKALPTATDGAEITDEAMPQHCDVCARAKAHQIISRNMTPEESSLEPFFRMSFDLIQMIEAANKHMWITHLECLATQYTIVATHVNKNDCVNIILSTLRTIKNRFHQRVAFLRSDGEKSLGTAFHRELQRRGITFEVSSPHTPEQNGNAERSGQSIVLRARALRISGNLPDYYWPEYVHAAAYITNRTPAKGLNWKTPFEKVHGKRPNISHLRVYGCKAYALNKMIPRSDKLQDRALIGYLVGYDSTNIYRIWVPSTDKIIRIRDVTFDENTKYSPQSVEQYHEVSETEEEPNLVYPRIRLNDEDIISSSASSAGEESSEDEFEESPEQQPDNEASSTHQKAIGASSSQQQVQLDRLPTPSPSAASDRSNSREEHSDSRLEAPQTQGTGTTESGQIQPESEPGLDLESMSTSLAQDVQLEPNTSQSPTSQTSGGGNDRLSRLGRLLPAQYDTPPDPGASRGNRAPRGSEISAQINPNSIIQGKRTRRSAYVTQLQRNQHSDQSWRTAFVAALSTERPPRRHRDSLPPEPKTYKEALAHPMSAEFLKAVETELQEVQGKGVWKVISVTDVQDTKEVIPLTWVFKYKFDENGYLLKCKARICVRGDLQTTQEDTFAATLAFRIFRALMAIICAFDLETRQYDVVNAFPHVPLEQTTYCKPPEGMTLKTGQVLQLLKALYGLKESPALWQRHFCKTLSELGLEPIPDAPCLYANNHLFVFFFVDDVIVAYHKDDERYAEVFQEDLFQRYEMRMMGEVQWFLALRIVRNRYQRLLWLSQESYINNIITRYNVKEVNAPATPLPSDEPLTPNENSHATPQDVHTFQSKMGSVQFAAISTRADIAFAASALSAYLTNPSHRHLALAQRLLEYLGGTKKLALCFNGSIYQDDWNIFTISSDAAYANDQETRRSHQGSLVTLFGGPVDWKATKQPTVTTSTTEAELLALSETAKQCFWWKRFFTQLQFDPGHLIQIQCDNQMTLRLMEESVGKLTTKLRHVDIHHHWLRQEALAGNIHFRWTPTADMIADGLTKALPKQKHTAFVHQLGLTPLPQE